MKAKTLILFALVSVFFSCEKKETVNFESAPVQVGNLEQVMFWTDYNDAEIELLLADSAYNKIFSQQKITKSYTSTPACDAEGCGFLKYGNGVFQGRTIKYSGSSFLYPYKYKWNGYLKADTSGACQKFKLSSSSKQIESSYGRVVFWLNKQLWQSVTVGNTYSMYLTIYNSAGNAVINYTPDFPLSLTCLNNSPGCLNYSAGRFDLPVGNYTYKFYSANTPVIKNLTISFNSCVEKDQ